MICLQFWVDESNLSSFNFHIHFCPHDIQAHSIHHPIWIDIITTQQHITHKQPYTNNQHLSFTQCPAPPKARQITIGRRPAPLKVSHPGADATEAAETAETGLHLATRRDLALPLSQAKPSRLLPGPLIPPSPLILAGHHRQ